MIFMLPLAASAIAAAAPAAMASAASATLGATIMATAKSLAMNLAVSTAMSALQPKVGGAGRMSDWMLDENAPIPFPMGRVGVSGAAVYQKTFGPDLMYKGVVSVLGGAGPIDGYESFKADEEFVTFDGNGKAITSDYANELWLKRTLGTQPDNALTLPPGLKNGGSGFGWTAAHKLSGKPAALHIMGENSKYTAFPTGEIKGIHVLRGLKGWDPRQDSTYPGGSGPCRLNNPATWVYLRRPGLWGLKWSLGLWEGPTLKGAPAHGSETDFQVGGIGAKLSGIDVAAFVALENICDANDWTVSGYPSTDDDKHEVLKSILQAGGAVYAQRAGKISCVIRSAPRASVVTITAADTAGEMQLDTGASRIDRLNTIRPQIVSENHGWQLTAIPKVSALAYRTEDGGTRSRGIDYSYVDKATQGAQLAALEIANTREAFAGIVPLKPHLQKIKPGDAFTIDDPEFVLDGQKCLCLNTEYSAETGAVTVTFVSETDAKYPFALGQTSTPPEPAELTPEDHNVTPPAPGEWALAAVNFTDGGVSVPVLLFTGDVQNARTESVIFEYRPVGAADWSFAGSEDQTVTRKEAAGGALTAGTAYEGAVSYRVAGRISTRLLLGPVNAGAITAGDVAPITPANVAGVPSLAITTTIAPDGTQTSRLWGDFADAADALSYVAEIDDGTVVQQVPLAESAIEDRIVATGPTYRYRVKAISRTGTLSAAWSAWSNLSTAGGDNTSPGPITAPYIQGGIGQITMRWTNPGDDDLARVLIFRNTSGEGPQGTGEAPYAWASGSNFVDDGATIGTVYYYWGLTQDRTGNGAWANLVYIGGASARRTRFDTDLTLIPPRLDPHPIFGGDFMRTDRLIYDGGEAMQALKPLEGGANKTETRVAAAFVGQGLLATKNQANFGTDLTAIPSRLNAHPTYGAAFIDTNAVVYAGGGALEYYRPQEPLANVTENRTAAALQGQGFFATANYADWSTRITGAGKPSDNAGTSGTLTPIGSYTFVQGNKVWKQGGTHGAYQGGAVGQPQVGSCYISSSLLSIELGGGWKTSIALETNGTGYAGNEWLATFDSSPGGGNLNFYGPGIYYGSVTLAGLSQASRMTLGYDGATVFAEVDGVRYFSIPTLGGQKFWPKVLDFYISINSAAPSAVVDVQQGAYSNLGDAAGLKMIPVGTAKAVGNSLVGISSAAGYAWGLIGGYSKQLYRGSACVSFRMRGDHPTALHGMIGLSDSPAGQVSYVDIDYAVFPTGTPAVDGVGCYESGAGMGTLAAAGAWSVDDVWAIDYDGVNVRYLQNGVVRRTVATTADRTFRTVVALIYGEFGFRDIQFGPSREAPAIDRIWNAARTAQHGAGEVLTASGFSAGYAGQTAWGTLTRSITSISKIDDTGRIIDGQALPLNGMSKSSTLNPSHPFSAGATPTTQINVAAVVATFAGGTTLSIGSATISGLTASTYYSIFRDLVANTYVAVSGSTTAYFTSAQRYLYIGTQATEEVGGGYEPLPPPPPGSGGGYGDIPMYVEP